MIQSNHKFYHRPHPAVRLLASPTHLIFQLIKFTTLPYMICQILNSNKTQNNCSKTETSLLNNTNHRPMSTLAPNKHSPTASNPSSSALESTRLFHQFIRQLDTQHQLINLLDQFLNLTQPPKLNPKTVQHIFAIVRPTLLDRLNEQNLTMQPRITTSTAWESEAMNQIVQMWYNQSRPINASTQPPSDDSNQLPKTIRTLQKMQTRRRAFILHGPSRCDCQRKPLPSQNIRLDQVGSLTQPTLVKFTQKLDRSINLLTHLRLIDLMRQAQRWDLVVIFLDRTRIDISADPKNRSRRLGQVTALLQFLRDHGRIEPDIDPTRMWSVHFVCESIERRLNGQPHEWARINRLSLDVLTQVASMPIGFDRRAISPRNSKKREDANDQRWPCVNFERHELLLGSLTQSTNELEFAVLTRERCERLLSKLTRLICQQIPSSNMHSWLTKSVVHLRLLEYLARQGTQQQFMSLLKTHLDQHPTSSKLAKLILLAARRFESLSENSEIISRALSRCDRQDLRPIIDFILRPQQPLETLKQNLDICLASLPAEKDARMKTYSHLIFRLSQLPTPSLALQVWEKLNREERSRKLLKVGRRTRHKLKRLIEMNGEEITTPIDKLPNQLIRSMVYVYKNLTHLSSKNTRNEFAMGKNYRSLYKRLSLKTKSNRLQKWPITKKLARSHLIFNLIKSELGQVEDYKILKSLENSLLSSPENDHIHHTSFENLLRFLLVNNIKGSERNLVKRVEQLERQGRCVQPALKGGRRRRMEDRRRNNRLKYFKFVRDWIQSRGGLIHRRPSKDKKTLPTTSQHLLSLPHLNNYKSTLPPPRRRSCSRYWARIVADHSVAPLKPQ